VLFRPDTLERKTENIPLILAKEWRDEPPDLDNTSVGKRQIHSTKKNLPLLMLSFSVTAFFFRFLSDGKNVRRRRTEGNFL